MEKKIKNRRRGGSRMKRSDCCLFFLVKQRPLLFPSRLRHFLSKEYTRSSRLVPSQQIWFHQWHTLQHEQPLAPLTSLRFTQNHCGRAAASIISIICCRRAYGATEFYSSLRHPAQRLRRPTAVVPASVCGFNSANFMVIIKLFSQSS